MVRNYFNYFTEVEEYFVRRRGKNLLVAPLDWCLIELWRDNGIPLHVALRGIDRSFEAALKGQKKPPRTLFYCHPAVMEAFEEYTQAMVGASKEAVTSSEESFSRQSVVRHLEELHRSVAKQQGEVFERVTERLRLLKSEVAGRERIDCEQVDRDLNEMGGLVVGALGEKLGQEKLKALKAEVKKKMKIYKKRLSKEMYVRLEQSYLGRRIRELYQIPEFSLLSLASDQ